jgi:GDP-L-fucose synthase
MKILITGGTGMVGSSFKKIKTEHELIFVGSRDYDLVSREQTTQMIKSIMPDSIIHLAAKVGGVKGNTDFVNDFFTQNIQMNTNVLECAHEHGVEKVISFLSTCVYPNKVIYPLTEDQIHNGPPHQSNFGYAYAKRMADIHSRTMRQQYGHDYICAIPNNLYGPNDNFDLNNGHVIPAIIRKIHEAKNNGTVPVMWGSGAPLREFTFSNDIPKILLLLLEKYSKAEPINIGCCEEISIRAAVEEICDIMDYTGVIKWDTTKPEGQFRKPSSNKKFLQLCPEFKYTSFRDGLAETCNWFVKQYPDVRGF